MIERVLARIKLLRQFPRAARRRREIDPAARALPVAPYVILYSIEPDTDEGPVEMVLVQRVMHGHRAMGRMF